MVVSITVLDTNDNPPQFLNDVNITSIPEVSCCLPLKRCIYDMRMEYSLQPQPSEHYFELGDATLR